MNKNLTLWALVWMFSMLNAYSQKTVQGTVYAKSDGNPLPGVTVLVKGTTTGTTTDIDGKYSMMLPEGKDLLVYKYLGMLDQEVTVGNQSIIDVKLVDDASELQEVVVTALGIEKDSRALAFSTAQVQGKELNAARITSPFDGLQGKVAGVNISTASGTPGASTKVVIRGYSSITQENGVLYVIDGVPMDNGANNYGLNSDVDRTADYGNNANSVNPDDIESISILKGNAATALYGSRAANGVILITTKRGQKDQKLSIELNSGITFSEVLRVPQLQNDFGQGWNQDHALDENGSWGPRFDGKVRKWGNVVDNSQLIKPYVALEDNLKDFYETGINYNNSVSVYGGNDNTTYYLSYSNINHDGVIPTDKDKFVRHTFSFRSSRDYSKLKSNYSLNFVKRDLSTIAGGQGGSEGATLPQEIIQMPRDISIVDMKDVNNKFYDLDGFFTPYAQNPYYPLYTADNLLDEERIYGNIGLDYQFTPWIKAIWRLGGDFTNSRITESVAIANFDDNGPNQSASDIAGSVTNRGIYRGQINSDFIAQFSKEFGRVTLSGLLGNNINLREYSESYVFREGLTVDGFFHLNNATSTPTLTPDIKERTYIGNYAQLEASLSDAIFLGATYRYDQSSTLPKKNNGYGYYSFTGSMVFSEYVRKGFLSFGKVRLAYGRTGNDAPPYKTASSPYFAAGKIDLSYGDIRLPVGGVNGFEVSNVVGNPELTPEFTYESEFGLEMNFMKNRIRLDASYYDRKTTDLILTVPLDPTSGYTSITRNVGEVENKGVELLIGLTPIRTSDFKWDVTFNYAKNNNKVLKLLFSDQPIQIMGPGEFFVSAYGITMDAVEGKSIAEIRVPEALYTPDGKAIVNENTGYQEIHPSNRESLGSALPDYTAGVSNTFTYKNISLNTLFDIRKGGVMYSYTKRLNYFVGNATQTTYNYRQPFIIDNSVIQVTPATNESPAVYRPNDVYIDRSGSTEFWNQSNNEVIGKDHVIDKSYVKLRQVSLSYSFPQSALDKTPFTGVQVSAVGRNLILWTPESNNIVDPESTTWGNDLASEFGEFAVTPTTRSYGFNLKVNF